MMPIGSPSVARRRRPHIPTEQIRVLLRFMELHVPLAVLGVSAAALTPTITVANQPPPPAAQGSSGDSSRESSPRTFELHGRVVQVRPQQRTLVVAHDAVSNYMAAMTMPFYVQKAGELVGLHPGDRVAFRLNVTAETSWIDRIVKTGTGAQTVVTAGHPQGSPTPVSPRPHNPLRDYPFTNELGQVVRLSDFKGQALAITFFFTRCPIPDFCPRLSKNFAEVEEKLKQVPQAPHNWHLLSVTFDPDFDTPPVLKAYAQTYAYDRSHWTFLTGPKDKIQQLAELSGVTVERNSDGSLTHNFRTLVIDAAGHMQMVFPTSGDLSDPLVTELLKGMSVPIAALPNTSSRLTANLR